MPHVSSLSSEKTCLIPSSTEKITETPFFTDEEGVLITMNLYEKLTPLETSPLSRFKFLLLSPFIFNSLNNDYNYIETTNPKIKKIQQEIIRQIFKKYGYSPHLTQDPVLTLEGIEQFYKDHYESVTCHLKWSDLYQF